MKTAIIIVLATLLLIACGGGDPTPSLVCEGSQRDGTGTFVPCESVGPRRP